MAASSGAQTAAPNSAALRDTPKIALTSSSSRALLGQQEEAVAAPTAATSSAALRDTHITHLTGSSSRALLGQQGQPVGARTQQPAVGSSGEVQPAATDTAAGDGGTSEYTSYPYVEQGQAGDTNYEPYNDPSGQAAVLDAVFHHVSPTEQPIPTTPLPIPTLAPVPSFRLPSPPTPMSVIGVGAVTPAPPSSGLPQAGVPQQPLYFQFLPPPPPPTVAAQSPRPPPLFSTSPPPPPPPPPPLVLSTLPFAEA